MIQRKLCLEKFREMIHCWSELLKFKRTERAKCSHIDSDKGKCLKFSRHFWLAGHCLQLHQSMQSGMCPLCALTANALECNKESFREWMQNDKYKSSKQYILSGNVMIILWFSHFFFFCMWKPRNTVEMQNGKFCHHLFTNACFQTSMTFILPWDKKGETEKYSFPLNYNEWGL